MHRNVEGRYGGLIELHTTQKCRWQFTISGWNGGTVVQARVRPMACGYVQAPPS